MNRIVVIDDEPALGENIQRMLRLPGTSVTAFVDPAKGLAETLANPYGVLGRAALELIHSG